MRVSVANPQLAAPSTIEVLTRLQGDVAARLGTGNVALAWKRPLGRLRDRDRLAWNAHEIVSGFDLVTPQYFAALGVPLLSGRDFRSTDDARGEGVAIVNDTLRAAGLELGDVAQFGPEGRTVRVVGIVPTAKYNDLTESPQPMLYLPFAQEPRPEMYVIGFAPLMGTADVQRAVRAAASRQPGRVVVEDVAMLPELVRQGSASDRALMTIAVALAALIVGTMTIGLYCAVCRLFERQRRELAIHAALGAGPLAIVRRAILSVARAACAGVVLGVAGAVLVGRMLSSRLYQVDAGAPIYFIAAAALITVVCGVSCAGVVRRALQLDLVTELR